MKQQTKLHHHQPVLVTEPNKIPVGGIDNINRGQVDGELSLLLLDRVLLLFLARDLCIAASICAVTNVCTGLSKVQKREREREGRCVRERQQSNQLTLFIPLDLNNTRVIFRGVFFMLLAYNIYHYLPLQRSFCQFFKLYSYANVHQEYNLCYLDKLYHQNVFVGAVTVLKKILKYLKRSL